jgi:uncharacterized protein
MKMKIKIRLIPKSSQNQICGYMADDILKIKLTAPPIDNEANKSLITFLAKQLKISKSNISISKGLTAKNKTLLIVGITNEELTNKLNAIISK